MTNPRLLALQCVACFALSLAYDLAVASYTLSLASRHIAPAMMLSAAMPFLLLLGSAWCADAKDWKTRIILTLASAAGYALGTWLALTSF